MIYCLNKQKTYSLHFVQVRSRRENKGNENKSKVVLDLNMTPDGKKRFMKERLIHELFRFCYDFPSQFTSAESHRPSCHG